MKKNAAAVLVSGGIDSAVLLRDALRRHKRVVPIYVRFGLRWERAERHWLRRLLAALRHPRLEPLRTLELPVRDVYGGHWSLTGKGVPGYRSADSRVYLPGRNLLLIAKAAVYCAQRRIPVLLLGPLKGNPFPDSTPRFFRAVETAVNRGLAAPVAVRAPYLRRRKHEIVRDARGFPWRLTFSCLRPIGLRPCGRCNKCAEREKVLSKIKSVPKAS